MTTTSSAAAAAVPTLQANHCPLHSVRRKYRTTKSAARERARSDGKHYEERSSQGDYLEPGRAEHPGSPVVVTVSVEQTK
jgi:hypothetical protein